MTALEQLKYAHDLTLRTIDGIQRKITSQYYESTADERDLDHVLIALCGANLGVAAKIFDAEIEND